MSKKRKRQTITGAGRPQTINRAAEFNPDYTQVKRDLRRIGTLAGSFILILIILSFFQEQLLALVAK